MDTHYAPKDTTKGPHKGVDPSRHDVNTKIARGIVPVPPGPLPGPPKDPAPGFPNRK